MAQADFAYDGAGDPGGDLSRLPLAVSIFADRGHVRDLMREDVLGAGLRVTRCGELGALLESEALPIGEVVLLDCPRVDASRLAALARLDMRVARSAAQLVVSTSVAALDDIFACLDQSQAQILVDPSRTERVVALGRVLGSAAGSRLRELSEEDRLALLRITEQVERILQKLGGAGADSPGLAGAPGGSVSGDLAKRLESPAPDWHGESAGGAERLVRTPRPALPDPRLVRRIIRQRQVRAHYFDGDLFADPAWDILLDLTAARVEHLRVSVTSLCIASGVPPTTALRWIGQMTQAGLLERQEDETDRRRAFIALTDKAADAMAGYFAELGRAGAQLV